MIHHRFCLILILSLPIPAKARVVESNEPSTDSIDQVLDLLEKKIIDTPEKDFHDSLQQKNHEINMQYKFSKPAKIRGLNAEKQTLDQLRNQVQEVETSIETIEANVNKLRNNLLSSSREDSFIEIYSTLGAEISLRSLKIIIDNITLIDLVDGSIAWNLADSIPIFFGPIKSGSHKLQVMTRVTFQDHSKNILSNEIAEINKIFDFHLPLGSKNHRFFIEVSKDPLSKKPILELKES